MIFEGGAVNRVVRAFRERKRAQVTAVLALAAVVVGGLAWGLSGTSPVKSSPAAASAATTAAATTAPVTVSPSASTTATATETPSAAPTTAAPSPSPRPTETVTPHAVATSSRPHTSPTTAKPHTSPSAPSVNLAVCGEGFQAQGVSEQWSADGLTDRYTAHVTLGVQGVPCPVSIVVTGSLEGTVKATRTYTTKISQSGDITATFDFSGVGCMDQVLYAVGIEGSRGDDLPGFAPSLC